MTRIRTAGALLLTLGLALMAACSSAGTQGPPSPSPTGQPTPNASDVAEPGPTRAISPTPTDAVRTSAPEPSLTPAGATRAPTPAPSASEASAGGVAAISEEQLKEELRGARFSTRGWKTDFRLRSISYRDIRGGGPSKDGIAPIDNPKFESVEQADLWLEDREPVQVVNINGDARAYPVQIMMWHEVVNDTVGGDPVVITY